MPKKKNNIADAFWKVFQPLPNLTVSEWAERYRVIPPMKSAEPGKWKNDRTPYLKKIMDAFNDENIEEIVFCSATQVGKTQVILNMLGYAVDFDPDSIMVVYPTEDTGRDVFRDFIDPMINSSRNLRNKKPDNANDYTLTRISFKNGATIFLAWANSPASLASKPIRYLFLDEVDKYPINAGKEASPIELAKERTSTFWNRKIVMVSTPTTESGHIWQAYEHADVQYHFYVPCPHCGHYQMLKFEQVRWENKTGTFIEAENTAYYECEKCGGKIYDHHKPKMLLKGEWRPDKRIRNYKTVAFHLSGLYSPWRTFGQFARKFLESKNQPEKLQNFVNSWLAEPWRDNTTLLKQEEAIESLKTHIQGEMGLVPSDAVALTAGVDVQADKMYFVIRAWKSDYTSWLILEGVVEDFDTLESVLFMNRYKTADGDSMAVELACIDSGFRTKEVYEFVAKHYPYARAIKGASTDLAGRPYSLPSSETKKQVGPAAPYIVNTNFYKDFIYMRMRIPPMESGSWYIYNGVSEDYLKQVTSEVRVLNKGKVRWVKRTEHAQNHLWDAEVYATVAADMLQVPFRKKNKEQKTIVVKKRKHKSNWISGGGGWL